MSRTETKNTIHTVNGVSGTASQLAAHFGVVSVKVALLRMSKSGWPLERAVTEPPKESMTQADFDLFVRLYPTIGPAVSELLSVKRSVQAMRTLACRQGLKYDTSNRERKHPYVGTRTYKAWFSAKQRCNNPKNQAYPRYGGSGITFHPAWNDFLTFLAEVGEAPTDRHTIDRIRSAEGYVPGNVRWATQSQNSANARSTNKTGYRGVDLLPSGRFRAGINVNGRKKSLGVFDTAAEAAKAYDERAVEMHGEFALTNDMAWSMA